MTTVTDLATQNSLRFRRGTYNILDCGIRTGKTYWAVNNLQAFTRDGELRRVLYLVDTNSLKESILTEYADTCADADEFWCNPSRWGEVVNKIGVMCYQAFGLKLINGEGKFLDNIDVICWDECDSIFDFATSAFKAARTRDFKRADVNLSNAEVLSVIQSFMSTKEYMPLILLGQWERIINDSRILCIGLSATPERARAYYSSLVSASNTGKLEAGYRIAEDIYFTDIIDHVRKLTPAPGRGYWCYSPYITPNESIVNAARLRGFNAIELHSPNNADKPMTAEQRRIYDIIVTTGMVPLEYDFIVVNKALARGINIIDRRFNNIIIDSYDRVDRVQAARQTFEYQRHLKTLMAPIPGEYLNRWLTVPECRELAEMMAVPNLDKNNKNTSKTMTWNTLKGCLPAIGYTVEQKRKSIDGKQQQACYITGEWRDAEIQDNEFLQLVSAKN